MKPVAFLKTAGWIVLGLALLAVAFDMGDIRNTMAALGQVGWIGSLELVLWRVLPVTLCAVGLWAIIPGHGTISLGTAVASRLARDGVSALLPVVPAGGELVSARIFNLKGLDLARSLAATVADVTMEIAAQALFSVIGFIMLLVALPGAVGNNWGGLAIVLPLAMVAGLGLLQHPKVSAWLLGLAVKLAGDHLHAHHLTDAIAATYAGKRRVVVCGLLHFAGWMIGTGEAWLALAWMGHPLPLANVIALESVVFAIKGIAFMIPWSVGVQEGGYMALGVALGVPPEIALSLSLVKRLPDLALGLPGVALWQWTERSRRRTHGAHADVPIEA
jgi:putative membrane protein